jgi:hypothetical protein
MEVTRTRGGRGATFAGDAAHSYCTVALLAVGGVACPSFAAAQEAPLRYELTPYAAYRFGGEFEEQDGDRTFELREGNAQGLIFNIRAKDVNTQWEALYAHQQTELETQASFSGGPLLDIDVDYLQFGGTYMFDGEDARPFIALTVGVAHFEPTLAGYDGETYFSGSLGGGVQLRANKRIGVRLEARAFMTLVDSEGFLFCGSGGQISGCALTVNGTALYQFEGRAGVVFRF